MADVGEVLLALIIIGIAAYYRFRRKPLPEDAPVVMSRSEPEPPRLSASVSQTDDVPDRQTAPEAPAARSVTLDTCKTLRARGLNRDEVRALFKPYGIALDNNVWAQAAPAVKAEDDDEIVTPFGGRRTKKSYYPDDPDLEYKPVN